MTTMEKPVQLTLTLLELRQLINILYAFIATDISPLVEEAVYLTKSLEGQIPNDRDYVAEESLMSSRSGKESLDSTD